MFGLLKFIINTPFQATLAKKRKHTPYVLDI